MFVHHTFKGKLLFLAFFSNAVDFKKVDPYYLWVTLTALGWCKLLKGDADYLGVTLTAWGWCLPAMQKISHSMQKISHTLRKCFFLEWNVENIKKQIHRQFFGPLPCPCICLSIIHLRKKYFFWLFLTQVVDFYKGDTYCLGVTLTA